MEVSFFIRLFPAAILDSHSFPSPVVMNASDVKC